ncbi:MAG: CrcB family protein [Candidatus Eremiobacteraeota bacterium]|nr:CrcB family protein [Candidatus Eremiobacteraeota bacterium]
MTSLGFVALGGALGSTLRYLVGLGLTDRIGHGFPWGTLVVNLSGSFCIGIVAELALTRPFGLAPLLRVFLIVGVLGGYTTFSGLAYENMTMIADGALVLALAYSAASVVAGTAAAFAGALLVRLAG